MGQTATQRGIFVGGGTHFLKVCFCPSVFGTVIFGTTGASNLHTL